MLIAFTVKRLIINNNKLYLKAIYLNYNVDAHLQLKFYVNMPLITQFNLIYLKKNKSF